MQQLPLGGELAQETLGELLVKDEEEEEPLSGTRQKRNLYPEQTSQLRDARPPSLDMSCPMMMMSKPPLPRMMMSKSPSDTQLSMKRR